MKLHDEFEGSMHAKVIVADDREAIVGSANFTHSGSHRNFEVGIRLWGPSVGILRDALTTMLNRSGDSCVQVRGWSDRALVRSRWDWNAPNWWQMGGLPRPS